MEEIKRVVSEGHQFEYREMPQLFAHLPNSVYQDSHANSDMVDVLTKKNFYTCKTSKQTKMKAIQPVVIAKKELAYRGNSFKNNF